MKAEVEDRTDALYFSDTMRSLELSRLTANSDDSFRKSMKNDPRSLFFFIRYDRI